MKNCFIVCPIGSESSATRIRSDKLFKYVISPVCKECNFNPIRIDKENTNGSLTDEIIEHLSVDDLIIADLTEYNPNAFYEIGYRNALKKPSIHLISKDSTIPFDISSIRTYTYDLTDLDSVDEIKNRLIQTIKSIDFSSSTPSSPEKNSFDNNMMINTQILQELFKIQDSIAKLNDSINSKDFTTISVLADKLTTISKKTPETVFMETLTTKIFENPEQILKFVEMSNQLPPNQENL